MVPPAVISELSRPRTPALFDCGRRHPPQWLEVSIPTAVPEVAGLGVGEREAISLAREIPADAVLIDDRDAVREARRHGFTVVGTLAILDEATSRSFISNLAETIERLVKDTNFRMNQTTEAIIRGMLQRDSDRKHGQD